MEYYTTNFTFYIGNQKKQKLTGQLKTLYPIDKYYPLDFYIRNVIKKEIEIDILYNFDNLDNHNFDLYLIDDHHLYYTYIYHDQHGIFYYS